MYDTFISYNSSDEAYAKTIYELLKSAGYSPFFATLSLPTAGRADFGSAIDEALSEVDNFVLVASSIANIKKGYVKAEWRLFVDEKRAGRKPGNIVTVLFGAIEISDLPIALRQFQVLYWSDQNKQDLMRFLTPTYHTLSKLPADVEHQIRQALPQSLRNAELTVSIQGNKIRVSTGGKEISVFIWEVKGTKYKIFPTCEVEETTVTHAKPHVRGRTIKRVIRDS